MKKCVIIGKFAINKGILDGQTVKCLSIYDSLKTKYDESQIEIIDTYNWKRHILKTLFRCFWGIKNFENIIMMPAHNGVKVFGLLLPFFNKFYKRKLHYVVIGSWLFELLKINKRLANSLKKFNFIYVETTLLKKELESIEFNNIYKMNNYKHLNILNLKELKKFENKKVLKTCVFSRINHEKGIEDAINVIKNINIEKIIISLDIYGTIEEQFKYRLQTLLQDNSNYVTYKGVIPSNKSVDVIKNYDLLLFPTRYKTEGIPGTIIDAFASGVPVLASSWNNYNDIIDNNINGIIFEFQNVNDFKSKLKSLYLNQEKIYNMKKNCIKKAYEYCSISALDVLFRNLECD